ncbi:MAG: DUF1573 domain-containing protein [bacterium]|nr:DUF1573 domain-containing protein [bacterium]
MSKKAIYILLATLVLVVVGVYLMGGKQNKVHESTLPEVSPQDVQITPESYDLGTVLMKDGFVIREYQITNNSQNILRLKNIATSCMCTKAQAVLGDKKTRFYGMEMSGATNPNIDFDIPGGETAKLVVRFDPAAHGIEGTGPFSRSVYLTFLDPVGQKDVSFSGEVILK